ncbi:hypothetical protein OGAPHI_005382 [Ogataea philodendri]|uniref:PDZ GRASP-type domain-containing protein n=1 Tax=Ogataea philodendri TaxID=1378263 RepID=A0A9P8P1B0_9ASCO|nr:uncharacterized protein OGAPHI_005382 [Ogataea philodendri]KAH3663392.1 hypothetical protein OGAPHI_005382 [Ogataea philodendri]
MFGFAKKLVSTLETQATNYLNVNSNGIDEHTMGLRVVSVDKDSVAEKYGFQSWFDFILSINGYEVVSFLQSGESQDSNPYAQHDSSTGYSQLLEFLAYEVNTNKSDLVFRVWSGKGGVEREITVPNHEFSAENNQQLDDISISAPKDSKHVIQNSAFKRLQFTLQLTPLNVVGYVWHVMRVNPNSPAYHAGIMPDEYILNCEGGLLATGGEDLLSRVIHSIYTKWQQSPTAGATPCSVVLYVYNHDYDSVRPVTVYPNETWGGRGLLGCDIGYGLLHRIPEVLRHNDLDDESDVDLAPGGVLFNAEPDAPAEPANLLQPAVQAPSFANTPAEPPARRKKASKHVAASDLSSYFEEETAKSKEIDGDRKLEHGEVPAPPKLASKKESS